LPVPAEFVAVTIVRSVKPTSAAARAYDELVAPVYAQLAPVESHRHHWKAKVMGVVPVHVPVLDDTVCPCWAVPEITGAAVHCGATVCGAAGGAETTPVAADTAVAEPYLLDAFTETRMVEPTSAATRT
jgi:hypothetical protein